jgi:alpha-tubulin suppressor-like RCC1 family protein
VFLWGEKPEEQIPFTTPKKLPLPASRVIDVACGREHVLALTEDGSLYGFGRNLDGQLGLGRTVSFVGTWLVGESKFSKMCMAITGHHERRRPLHLWLEQPREHTSDTFEMTRVMGDVVSMASGASDCLVMTKDGSLWTWGENECGQLMGGSEAPYYELQKRPRDSQVSRYAQLKFAEGFYK